MRTVAIVTNAKTASEFRDEVVKELARLVEQGRIGLDTYDPKLQTQEEHEFNRGYNWALKGQLGYWRSVWIDAKQHHDVARPD